MSAFWEAGCLGVEVLPAVRGQGPRRLELRAYFPGRAARRPLEIRLGRALAVAGIRPGGGSRLSVVRDRRWAEVWQRSLKPMRIGRSLLIVPRGCHPPRTGGRRRIGVRFGQAFGTGEHASTRMSLRLLEAHLLPGDRVLDLGTGTGILAMAAARLGAGPVRAVDNDPVALQVARANLHDNRLGSAVTLSRCDAGRACARRLYDLALVNIGASCIARILPDIARGLAPGGRVVLSGILVDDEPAITRQAARLGLRVFRRLRTRPWSALLMSRPARDKRLPARRA